MYQSERLLKERIITLGCWIVLSVFSGHILGQQMDQDSLLRIAESGISRQAALAYKELARISPIDSLARHIFYAKQGMVIANQLGDHEVMGNLLMNMGVINDIHGNFDPAISYYDSAYGHFIRLSDPDSWLATLYINYGTAYYYANNRSLALDYYLKAYDHCAKDTSDLNYGTILNNLGSMYEELNKPEDAITYYALSAELKRQRNDRTYPNTLQNMGRLYGTIGDFEKAYEYLDEAINNYDQQSDQANKISALVYKAEVLLKDNRPMEAERLIRPIGQDTFANQPATRKIESLIISGDIYQAQNQHRAAIRQYKLAENFSLKYSADFANEKILDKLASNYAEIGQYQSAFKYLKKSKELLQEMTGTERLTLEQEMQVKFNTLQKEQENIRLQTQNAIKDISIRKNKLSFLIALIGFIGASILAFQIYRSRKKIQGLNFTLTSQQDIIRKSLKEKELLLKEIHHRVKNNLQVVSSLLGIQSRQIQDKAAQDAILLGRARVHSMSLIHQDLYQKDYPTGVEIKGYLRKLVASLLQTYNTSPEKIQLETHIDPLILDVDTVIPLGLIINELISNALKYAFPDGHGKIEVRLFEKDQTLMLKIKDNGIGMIDASGAFQGTSFGYDLIQSLVNKLEGELDIQSKNGTEVNIRFKNYQKAA